MTSPARLALSLALLSACGPEPTEPLARIEASAGALYVLSGALWPGPIPVCWEGPPADAEARGWARDAVERSWPRVSSVRFTGWGTCAAGARGIHVRVGEEGPYTLGLGTALDGVSGGLSLNFTFRTWSTGCQATRELCVRAGAIHEFGHALGFAHEQNRPDTPSWCTSEQGAPGDALVGPWDLGSIMNYCNPRWTGDGQLSATDIEGVRAAYGAGDGEVHVATSSGGTFAGLLRSRGGAGASRALLADVTGDRRADLVLFFGATGDWWVAPAAGDGTFAGYRRFRTGHGAGSSAQLLGDVTGDGRADAVAFFGDSGSWWVAPSTGAAFGPYARWKTGHGAGSSAQLLGDVTGDGRADAVAFFGDSGSWWVAPSTGAAFGLYALWKTGHGAGSSAQLLGDVTGDGRADAVAFFGDSGSWWAAPSTGAAFGPYALWAAGLGASSIVPLLGDVTGDGRADAVLFEGRDGRFTVAPAGAGAFQVAAQWRRGLGTSLRGGAVQPLLGDVTGEGRADAAALWGR